MFNIVLVEPEIPHNTGNIARTCVAMNCHLHLVEPLGFSIDDKQVRRAGLDYWPHLKLSTYRSWENFLESNRAAQSQMVFFTTKSKRDVFSHVFSSTSWLVFGPETRGLDQKIIDTYPESTVCIPMIGSVRSLNLSNAAAIGVYEAYRQVKHVQNCKI